MQSINKPTNNNSPLNNVPVKKDQTAVSQSSDVYSVLSLIWTAQEPDIFQGQRLCSY